MSGRMKGLVLAAMAAAGVAWAGAALAQGSVVAERRAAFREVGQHMEAIGAAVQARTDQRALVARVDQMAVFFRTLPDRVPVASLTPPVAQGTQDGQTRALAAIDANRAGFADRNQAMLAALVALRGAAEAGTIGPDLLRTTGGTCGACHQAYRAR